MTQEEEILLSLEDINPREIASHIEHGTLHQWIKSWKAETRESIIAALRPVSREQVEKMRGEWVAKHRHRGGFRRATGVDDMGEQRTITIDERCEYDDRYCSKCGKQSPDNFLNFCGYCGAPMTDEAVEMVMERMEAMKDGKGD